VEHRLLGTLSVSVVGVGCNNFGTRLDERAARAVVDGAIEHGVTFFDTADVYGSTHSEEILGRAMGTRRTEIAIATKFGMPLDDERFGASPLYVRSACEASLRRLGTEYIDLYQLHAPDPEVPITDTLGALADLVTQGKVRQIGCSNLTVDQLRAAKEAAGSGPAFVSIQNQYSLLWRLPERDGVLAACDELDLGFLPYYPLANGLLTGKVRPGEPVPEGTRLSLMGPERAAHWLSESFTTRVGELLTYAQSISTPILTLAFSWLLSHRAVSSVIAGASTPEQVAANVAAVQSLDSSVVRELDRLTATEP
jgi:aryl-alcohol dehydrogenase-like predicted oxidoreductase